MPTVLCILLGYFMGTFSPADILAKRKNKNLRETGTKNLGASNALLVLGWKSGLIVMVLDIAKAYLAAKIARLMFPKLVIGSMAAALGAVIGHIFPFHLQFSGGKGLAAFGGLVMAYRPGLFVFYLVAGCVLMIIVNYSWIMPIFAGLTFPLVVLLETGDPGLVILSTMASGLVVWKHWSNIGKAFRGEDNRIRDVIKNKIFAK